MQGRVIVITGAGGALGSVVAQAAAARGAKVVKIDHAPLSDDDGLGGACIRLGGVDLTKFEQAAAAINEAAQRAGALHALLNIAGGFRWQTVEDGAVETWDKLYALNLKTALNSSKAALPHLIASGEGRIVNVGALGAVKADAGMGAYAASKAGVAKLTESLAEEVKAQGVTVNAVLPSIIDTPANRADMPEADFSKWVVAADLAAVMLFLASPEARAITGALVPVPGKV